MLLADLRYSAHLAGDSADALSALLGPYPPEIALLDADLPGQSGLEIAAEVKRRCRAKQTWIILLASAADAATVTVAADAGVDDLLLFEPDASEDPINEADFQVRLSVAARMQEMGQQIEAQAQAARFHALRDQLTGLWNRESLLSMLFPETDRVQRLGTPLALLLMDLDHFGRVNDEYGHETGDKILQELASRLRRSLRSYDLVGRCGDDEFLIALPGCTMTQAKTLAERIRATLLHRPFDAGRDAITLTASMGLAQSRGRSPLVALREAERALAAAKVEGRNCDREYIPPVPQLRMEERRV